MGRDLFQKFANGTVAYAGKHSDLACCEWVEHKDFAGVFLKNVISAEQTGGLFSCHLVRIEPCHKIGLHTHPGSIELHEVITGSGVCLVSQETLPYAPGGMAVIACDAPHEVRAGKDGLCLFAKFVMAPTVIEKRP